jgi:hypothetical protein
VTRLHAAITLLSTGPLPRREIERRLGLSQQRVSEVLRAIGAQVVAYEPRDIRGHPHPIYGMCGTDAPRMDFNGLTTAWRGA